MSFELRVAGYELVRSGIQNSKLETLFERFITGRLAMRRTVHLLAQA
jgi:hypothetical protein